MDKKQEFLLHNKVVSAEAMSLHMPNRNMVTNFVNMVGKFTGLMSSSVPELEGNKLDARTHISNDLVQKAIDVPYRDLKDLIVSVPSGLQVDLLTYTNMLLSIQVSLNDLYESTLIPFNRVVSNITTNPKDMSSISNLKTLKLPDIDKLKKQLDSMFNKSADLVPYWKAVKRQADLILILNAQSDMVGNSDRQPTELITSAVKKLSNSMDTVSKMAQDPNSGLVLSSPLIKQLADITFTIAELVSMYSTIHYSAAEVMKVTESLLVAVTDKKNT